MRLRLITGSVVAAVLVGLIASATLGAQTAATKTATEAYKEYQAAFAKATKIDDLVPYWSADMVKGMKETPAAQRAQMFEMVKMFSGMYSDVKVVKEERTSKGATLSLEGLDPDKKKATGIVPMTRENGVWKVGKEEWKS